MEIIYGFNQNLEGFIIQGNLYVQSSLTSLNQGDGSIKLSGSLYTNIISEYIDNIGVNINNVLFRKDLEQIIIPYTTPSNLLGASIITNGGITIKHTENSSSITSGGGITVLGGGSFAKNVNIGGTLDMNYNSIINVHEPLQDLHAANKYYVDHKTFGNIYSNFSSGALLYGNSSGSISDTNLLHFDDTLGIISLYNTDNSIAILDVYGKSRFRRDVEIDGILNISNNKIINVANPIVNTDAANKYYVDSKTYGNLNSNFSNGALLFGNTFGNISDTSIINFNGLLLTFLNTNGNSIDSYGKVQFRDTLDMTYNNIINIAPPLLATDAANKYYVDSKTYGNLNSNFSNGALLFGNTSGSISDTSLINFDGSTLNLYNTDNTTSVLNVQGKVTFNKDLIVKSNIKCYLTYIRYRCS
jgi:hypothetical protein